MSPPVATTLEFLPTTADAKATLSSAAERAIELGWADRPTIERFAEGIRTWGKHPDALWITPIVQTIGWRS